MLGWWLPWLLEEGGACFKPDLGLLLGRDSGILVDPWGSEITAAAMTDASQYSPQNKGPSAHCLCVKRYVKLPCTALLGFSFHCSSLLDICLSIAWRSRTCDCRFPGMKVSKFFNIFGWCVPSLVVRESYNNIIQNSPKWYQLESTKFMVTVAHAWANQCPLAVSLEFQVMQLDEVSQGITRGPQLHLVGYGNSLLQLQSCSHIFSKLR